MNAKKSMVLLALGLTAVLMMTTVAQAAPLAGAIFTTTPNDGIVNENVRYQSKLEVYLDSGPGPNAPQTAAGLPDGAYYFQVTDPSGKVLLSMDPAKCRKVQVSGGVITTLLSIGETYTVGKNTFPCSVQAPPTPPYDPKVVNGVAGPSGRHDTNQDIDHGPPAIVVQLMPFWDTPNPGGVYKAWMIPVATYDANGGDPTKVPTLYWNLPFDGVWTPSGNTYFGTGAWAEISDYLVNSVSADTDRFQLSQQLLAFIFNVRYRLDSQNAMIYVNGPWASAQSIINQAITVWATGDAASQHALEQLLDGLNNSHAVPFMHYLPCPVEYP